MTKWLASVQSLEEAQQLASTLPDILDMKNPAKGALGALSVETVSAIVDWVQGRCLTSATVGDLVMQADVIADAIASMTETDVDYIKVGLFADPTLTSCLQDLTSRLTASGKPVIAVLFADQHYDLTLLPLIKQSGFSGVMVDTASKNGKSLLDHWSVDMLTAFIETARRLDMLCGLAGALRLNDIERLEVLGADYLGFRSALCRQHQRTDSLDPAMARQVQQRLQQFGLAC